MSDSPYYIINTHTGKHLGPFSTETDAALAKSIARVSSGWKNGKVLGRKEFDEHLGVSLGGESGSPPNLFAEAKNINQVLNLAVGAASVCWETPEGAGVFDSDRALDIAKAASERIHEMIDENG